MAEWDPLGEPAETAQTNGGDVNGQAIMGMPIEDGLMPIEGCAAKVSAKDMIRTFTDLSRKFDRDPCWQMMPNPKPDLSWHKATCSLDDWKHTDVKVELGPGIAYVTLNRPAENNVLSESVVAGLCDAVLGLHGRPDLRAVVFSGEGKMLSAGRDPKGDPYGFSIKVSADIEKAMATETAEALKGGAFPDGKVNVGRMLQARLWNAVATLPQFTICLANGSALGDGMGLLLCCDMAVGLRSSYFGFSDTKLGMVSASVLPYVLAKTSAGTAKNMFAMSQMMSADLALEKCILNRVVENVAEGHAVVKEICQEVTKCAPGAVALAKELVLGVAGRQVDETVVFYTMAMATKAASSAEAKQGIEALAAQKAKPWESSAITPLH